ncbi:MAG: ribonuclease P protein component [Candidatus Cloacimonetes bacterium]|jgi:ribonuclease P protein component|nr:ribonuclease P protein component [Candidatus Cloacimonadota bacterium]MDI9523913.1 ribonuclease P protein component [Candidatus Cloacimonadota bacterium]NLH93527.1 ribonuclease P protein component [Candidatus Cloacimonadota bacterium]HPB43496.1 ribonuclease P protein component [Candidatus Syntrophosphaera sp.]
MLRRITKHSEYREFSSPDLFLRSDHFYAAVLFDPHESALGITIGKKIGKAHTRNLLKRRIKAWARLRCRDFPQGFKLNLIARPGAGELSWNELCAELDKLSTQLRERC